MAENDLVERLKLREFYCTGRDVYVVEPDEKVRQIDVKNMHYTSLAFELFEGSVVAAYAKQRENT